MLIVLESKITGIKHDKSRIKFSALARLARYYFSGQEQNLNKYLQENYNITLFKACEKLANNFNLNIDKSKDQIYISFDKELDKLASLITYGNLQIKGSNIIKKIFKPIF